MASITRVRMVARQAALLSRQCRGHAIVGSLRAPSIPNENRGFATEGKVSKFDPSSHFPIQFVSEREQWVVERFGKFKQLLNPGINFLVPLIECVAYKHPLKVRMVEMHGQLGISKDNVELEIDGVLYWQVQDAYKASYNIENPSLAISQLATGIMRAELGKLGLERIFEERTELNERIMDAINESCEDWGVVVLRYEVCDIKLPRAVKEAMQLQTIAERKKRERVIASEGERREIENVAEGEKTKKVLESEAAMLHMQNIARGEAFATLLQGHATARAIQRIGNALGTQSGQEAARFRVASRYVDAFEKLAKETNTMLLPANPSDASSVVAQAMGVFKMMNPTASTASGPAAAPTPPPAADTSDEAEVDDDRSVLADGEVDPEMIGRINAQLDEDMRQLSDISELMAKDIQKQETSGVWAR